MSITLKLTFPGGRYHATPWGRHVNEGVAEWPPSPWRLLRALVATWKRKCAYLSEEQVRRVLEQLVQPPLFHLPVARVAHTRHAMPMNIIGRNYKPSNAERKAGKFQGDPSIVFDTFVSIGRNDPTVINWPDAKLDVDDRVALERLLENLTTLGRAEGWVQAELSISEASDWNCCPASVTDSSQELVQVFCPDPDTAFGNEYYPPVPDAKKLKKGLKPSELLFDCPRWHLCLDTEIIRDNRWPRVPGALWRSYARSADAFTQAVAPVARTTGRSPHTPTVARFLIDGPVLPLVTDTIRVAEAFRRAAMGRFGVWCKKHPSEAKLFRRTDQPDKFSSRTLSGKEADGTMRTDHEHAHYLPTSDGDDPRRITHVTVFAREGFGPAEVAALIGLHKLTFGEGNPLRVQLVGLGKPDDFRSRLFEKQTEWISLTPFVGPAHIGRNGRVRYLRKALRREVKRAAERGLLPTAAADGFEIELAPPSANSVLAREFRRKRERSGDEVYRPCEAFRIRFKYPVAGPLCLGYACHYGLGLFVPTSNLYLRQ